MAAVVSPGGDELGNVSLTLGESVRIAHERRELVGSRGRSGRCAQRLHAGRLERYFARMQAERDGIEPPGWAMQDIPETIRVGIGETT